MYLVILSSVMEVSSVTRSGRLQPVPRTTHSVHARLSATHNAYCNQSIS